MSADEFLNTLEDSDDEIAPEQDTVGEDSVDGDDCSAEVKLPTSASSYESSDMEGNDNRSEA